MYFSLNIYNYMLLNNRKTDEQNNATMLLVLIAW